MGLRKWLKEGAGINEDHREQLEEAGALGSAAIPGESGVDLPAGVVRVTYCATHKIQTTGQRRLALNPQIEIALDGQGLQPVFEPDRMPVGTKRASGAVRVVIGRVEIGEPGAYKVTTKALDDYYLKEGTNPRLLFDQVD